MPSEQTRLVYVFFSYARQDRALRDKLDDHLCNLKYRGLIETWHDREITAGTDWVHQIDIHLDTADIILLLISSSFMASEYCYSIEMQRAIERHERKEARVIPILLRPVLYTDAPFAKFQFLPTNSKPVVNWRNRDSAFVDIALGIERVVQDHLASVRRPVVKQPVATPKPSYHSKASEHFRRIKSVTQTASKRHVSTSSDGVLSQEHPSSSDQVSAARSPKWALFSFWFGLVIIVGVVISASVAQTLNGILLVISVLGSLLFLLGVIGVILGYRERTYYGKALAAYEQAISFNYADATAQRGMGNALEAFGRYNEALEAFEAAVNLQPTSAAYSGMGRILLKLKRYDESLAAFERALQLDPDYAPVYGEMCETLEQLGRSEEAQQAREKAKQLGYEE